MNSVARLAFMSTSRQTASDALSNLGLRAERTFRSHATVFIIVYFVNFAVYAYLFSSFIFTNHTMQNAVLQSYPSYRTVWEGRWLHDIILQVAGGLGTQSLQMFVGVGLQVTAALVFARIIGVRRRIDMAIVALLISLHPTVMDYYSFDSDAISFTLGDLLIVLGGYALLRPGWGRVAFAALAFFLALSIYQPKISMLALVLLLAGRQAMLDGEPPVASLRASAAQVLRIAGRLLLPTVVACFGYWCAMQVAVSQQGGVMKVVDVGESPLAKIAASYVRAAVSIGDLVGMLFFPLPWIILLAVAGGVGATILSFMARPSIERGLGVAVLALVPPCVYLAYILNAGSWSVAGRLSVPEAYALAFLLSLAWPYALLRPISSVAAMALIFVFAIVGAQEAQAANLRSTLELQRLQRILSRIESDVPDLYSHKHDLLIIGHLPTDKYLQFVRLPWRANRPNLSFSLFATFHQVEYLNLLAGAEIFDRVQTGNRDALLTAAATRPVWPAPGSVFVANDTVVVKLEDYRDGTELTDRR